MILTIILAAMSPAIFAALDVDELSPVAAIMMPFVIILAVFYFRNQEKQLRTNQFTVAPYQAPASLPPPPASPLFAPKPVGDTAHQTGIPVGTVPTPSSASVTEDETRRFGEPR